MIHTRFTETTGWEMLVCDGSSSHLMLNSTDIARGISNVEIVPISHQKVQRQLIFICCPRNHLLLSNVKNSSRVFALDRIAPSMQLVVVEEAVFSTPLITIHK